MQPEEFEPAIPASDRPYVARPSGLGLREPVSRRLLFEKEDVQF
jgi:hypothetical protein